MDSPTVTAAVSFIYSRGIPAFIIFVGFAVAAFVTEKLILRAVKKMDERRTLVIRFVGRSAKYVLLAVGVISALGTMGVDVSAVIAGLGLTGFALSLALKDAVSNLIAGILIIVYTPFTVGDKIKVAGVEGRVEEINLRYVSLRLDNGALTLIPNSKVLTEVVHLR